MNGKDFIINKIIKDSQLLADSFIQEAQEKADIETLNAKKLADDNENKSLVKIENEKNAIIKQKETFAEIEVKKKLLSLKQDLITDVFNTAEEKIISNTKSYKELLIKFINIYCEEGDCVILSFNDKALITDEEIKAIATKNKITLNLEFSDDDYKGLLIRTKKYYKNLMVKTILRQIKEKYITEISQILFNQGA